MARKDNKLLVKKAALGASLVVQGLRISLPMQGCRSDPWSGNLGGFPGNSTGKESTCNVGDLGSIPGLGRSPAEGNGYPLQYSGLENSMDCKVQGVAQSQT